MKWKQSKKRENEPRGTKNKTKREEIETKEMYTI